MTVTRFAPSPTGNIHIGNLRAALFSYLITRKAGGKFVLRIDDTDPVRSKQAYVDQIMRDLEWLGIEWDRFERQSARLELYEAAAQELRDNGRLYEVFETPTELDLKRKKQLNMGKPPVYDRAALALSDEERAALRAERDGYWRYKLDDSRVTWDDGIIGAQSIDAASVSDPVLIKADGQFLYTLASVVDDRDFGITHIVRGADHITNTATQIQIFEGLGAPVPQFAHHSLLTGPSGEALSKRIGSLAIKDFKEMGAEPMALVSMMSRLGSSLPVEVFDNMDEVIEGFDLGAFGAAPTKFDPQEVMRLSGQWLRQAPIDQLDVALAHVPEEKRAAFHDMARENVETRADFVALWDLVEGKNEPVIADEDREFVETAMTLLPEGEWGETTWGTWTSAVKEATGRKGKGLFLPLRRALTGQDRGPDMSKLMALRGGK